MDTWLDAVRNLRNYCAHPSMVVGMTSSVVIPDNRDSADVLPDNTNLYLSNHRGSPWRLVAGHRGFP